MIWLFLIVTDGQDFFHVKNGERNNNKDIALVFAAIVAVALSVPFAIGFLHRCFS